MIEDNNIQNRKEKVSEGKKNSNSQMAKKLETQENMKEKSISNIGSLTIKERLKKMKEEQNYK